MASKEELAVTYFETGYSCAQAVVLAFHEECGITEKQAAKLASSFGGGMGKLREVCGAVTGMFLVLGMLKGYDDPHGAEEKAAQYAKVQEMAARFREKNGSILCRELLENQADTSPVPAARTASYYAGRPCGNLVADGARIVAEFLQEQA